MDPPGLRRLRFPFFDLLVKERWSETATDKRPGSLPPRRCENEARHPVTRGSLVSIRRLPAHCRSPVHGARTTLISLNRYPCQRLEQDYLRACPQRATSHVPQNGQHCGADEAWEARNGIVSHVGSGDSRYWAFDTGARTGRNCRDPRGQHRLEPAGARGRHGGCTPGATHHWVADASTLGMTSCTAARMPTCAARTARSATSMSATMPTRARAVGFAGC